MNKKKSYQNPGSKVYSNGLNVATKDLYLFLSLIFLISISYFYWFGNAVFFHHENHSLFLFSKEYLKEFTLKPGGLLEYAGNFIQQGYYSDFYGSVVVSLCLLLFAALLFRINKLLIKRKTAWTTIITFGPACLLLLMQMRYDHFIHYTLGYLFLAFFILTSVLFSTKGLHLLVPILFPFFFYLAGSLAFIFLFTYAFYCLLYKNGGSRFILPGILVMVAILTLLLFQKVLFMQAPEQYFRNPLPIFNPKELHIGELILSAYLMLLPLVFRAFESLKWPEKSARGISQISSVIVLVATLLLLGRLHNSESTKSSRVEKLFFQGEWDKVIEKYEKEPANDKVTNYYYNLALSEKGLLCDRLFYGSQNFGENALVLPLGRKYLQRSMYYYYSLGFSNEAHHLAFESMVLNGYSPENLKMLIKTDLINKNYKSAEKYIRLIKQSYHYRKWAERYEDMLDNPALILSDPELGAKKKLLPRTDFYITQDVVTNINLMLMSNPDNKLAFEYKLARMLLKKDYKSVVYQVKKMRYLDYNHLPQHIEEATILFNQHNNELPYLGGFEVSDELKTSFEQFIAARKENKNKTDNEGLIQKSWRNTFWYYSVLE